MDGNQIVPLTADIELRPARSSPVSLRRMLGPMFERCVVDIEESTDRLKKLADAASSVHDLKAESALRAKIVDQCTQILRLCRADSTTAYEEPRPIRSQEDVTRWDSLPPAAKEKILEGMAIAAREGHADPAVVDILKRDPADDRPFSIDPGTAGRTDRTANANGEDET